MISIIIPAYNEEKVIGRVVRNVMEVLNNRRYEYEIIVVDDGSNDNTRKEAEKNGAKIVKHPYNIGNGAAVKTGIRNAHGDILVLMDGDGQHDPDDIPKLLKYIPEYDMVIGTRTKKTGLLHRSIANKLYNWFASYLTHFKIMDLTSGFRAVKREIIIKYIYLLPNTFSYPTTSTMAFIRGGHSIKYVPIEAQKRVGKSKIKLVKDGSRFILIMIKIATFFSPLRVFIPISLIAIIAGIMHGLYKVIILNQRYTYLTIFFISTGILIFLMGLIAEQIAQLRFDRSEN